MNSVVEALNYSTDTEDSEEPFNWISAHAYNTDDFTDNWTKEYWWFWSYWWFNTLYFSIVCQWLFEQFLALLDWSWDRY